MIGMRDIELLKNGDLEAFERVYRAFWNKVYQFSGLFIDDDFEREDIVQEVFLKLLTARPSFRDSEHEKAWLIRTTLHRASDLRRSAARRNVPLEEAAQAAAPQAGSELLTAVRALPEPYSAVIHLYYYEEYSIKEIAKLLGVPTPTVGTRLARGRERLRRLLKEDDA